MEETVVCSKKINLSKKFMIAWIVVAVLLIAVSVFSVIKYSKYKKTQEEAVGLMLLFTNEFDQYQHDYKTMVKEMYNYFNISSRSVVIGGFRIDNSDLVEARSNLEDSYARFLSDDDGYRFSYYLEYTDFVDYTTSINRNLFPFIVWGALAFLLGALNLCYFFDSKKEIILASERILCKKGKKIAKEFFVRDIKSVEIASMKGLKIRGTGFKYKINLLSNANELKTTIMDSLETLSTKNVSTSENSQAILPNNADELKKYKELLDNGIITTEEFNAKKKQLLGL